MHQLTSLVTVAAVALAAVGCVADPYVSSVEPKSVRDVGSPQTSGAYVPAGSVFAVRMDIALDTLGQAAGTPFTARTEGALVASDGRLVVPAHSIVHGTLVSVGDRGSPRMRIDFQTIDTLAGPARLHAALVRAERVLYDGPPVVEPTSMPTFQDGYIYSSDFEQYGLAETPRSGRSGNADGYELVTPREILVPRSARLELVLTQALVPSGTSGADPR